VGSRSGSCEDEFTTDPIGLGMAWARWRWLGFFGDRYNMAGKSCLLFFSWEKISWLVVWNMNGLWLSIYWECHHPNWRVVIFFRGVGHPPTSWKKWSSDQLIRALRGFSTKLVTDHHFGDPEIDSLIHPGLTFRQRNFPRWLRIKRLGLGMDYGAWFLATFDLA
jgi:hypothetical protein